MIKKVDLSLDQLDDLRTHMIQKKIDLQNEILSLLEQQKIATQLVDALSLLINEKPSQ